MRLSVHFRLAAAWMLLLGLAGSIVAQEGQIAIERTDGFGYIAQLQAALAEQKACEAAAQCDLKLAQCRESTEQTGVLQAATSGLLQLFTGASAPCEESCKASCEKCCDEIVAADCATGACIAAKACGTEQCKTTIACNGASCATKNCDATHCVVHGCAKACETKECPSGCALHECPESMIIEWIPATKGSPFASEPSGKSICQTKSCARLTASGADCCCKDGSECGCQSDGAVAETTFADAADQKTWNLLKAADLLEEAGLTVHAREVRAHADREMRAHKEALLARKVAELAKLQAEVNAITKSLGRPAQVLVEITVLEMPIGKLQSLGLDLGAMVRKSANPPAPGDAAEAATDHEIAVGVFDSTSEVLQLVDTLEKCKLVKIVANPRLVAQSGQSASFVSGGQFPTVVPRFGVASVEYCEFGTRINVCPTVIGDQLHLELKPRVTELEKSAPDGQSEGQINSLKVRLDAQSTTSMKPGQTLVMVAMPHAGDSDEPGVLLLATASLAKGSEAGEVAPATYTPSTASLPTIIPPPATGSYYVPPAPAPVEGVKE